MLNILHHVKDPLKAISEMNRCLKAQGKIIMIEPYITPFSHLIYRYLHHEDYLPSAEWKLPQSGRLSAANTTLPWIVLSQDKIIFAKTLPQLKITSIALHTPFRYLISGGLTRYQFLPTCTYPLIKTIEKITSPLHPLIGMFATINLQKD